MNEQPAAHRWNGSSRRLLTGAVLIAVVLSGALSFILTPSSASKLRADLKKRGFKLTLRDLAAGQPAASKSIDEFIKLDSEIERLTSLRPESPLAVMSLQPSAPPIPWIKKEKPFCDATSTNFCAWTWDDLAAALQQAKPALARLRTLARQDVSVYWQGTNSGVFHFINEGRWLSLEAVSALHSGASARALEDVEAILGLAAIGADEKSHIMQIGRLADMRFGLKTCWEILQSTDLTELELIEMAAAWERITPLRAAEFAAEGELVWAAEMAPEMQKELAQASFRERLLGVVGQLDLDRDAEFLLRYHLAFYDAARALQRGENWNILRPGVDKFKSAAYPKRISRYRHLGLRMMLSRVESTLEDSALAEAAKQLLLVDLSIRRFKLRHGMLPKTLRELTPEFLNPDSGHDVYGTGDLKYRPNPDSTYLLYSVGVDGVDNGGDDSLIGDQRFWNSRDMVWPSCR